MFQLNLFPLDGAAVAIMAIIGLLTAAIVVCFSLSNDCPEEKRGTVFWWSSRTAVLCVVAAVWCIASGSQSRVDIESADIPISEIRRSDGSVLHVYQTDDGRLHNFNSENGRCPAPGEAVHKVTSRLEAFGLKWDDKIQYRVNPTN